MEKLDEMQKTFILDNCIYEEMEDGTHKMLLVQFTLNIKMS